MKRTASIDFERYRHVYLLPAQPELITDADAPTFIGLEISHDMRFRVEAREVRNAGAI